MRAKTLLIVGLLGASLGGCAAVQANREYQTSSARYKECLLHNPATPQNCEGLRLAMETDERQVDRITDRIAARRQSTVIIQNR